MSIVNDIVINDRKFIVELGGGLSTVIISNILSSLGGDRTLLTIEHDQDWLNIVKSNLDRFGDAGQVNLIHAGLIDCKYSISNTDWYDTLILKKYTEAKKIDTLIIDGPPAYMKGKSLARYPALPFLFDLLSDNCSIFLDDGNRHGEKKIANLWEKKYNLNFSDIGGNMLVAFRGDVWNVVN
jgi:hypothetical protein